MPIEKTNKYYPSLRFPAFQSSEQWKTKRLGDIAELYAGATPSTSVSEYWTEGTIPWMSSGEVHNGQIFVTEKKITLLGYDRSSTKMVPANSVIVALAGQGKTRGSVAITRISLCTNQSLCSILPNETYDSDYLYFFLKNQYETLRFISSGDGTRGGLNLQMLRDFLIRVPSLEEQQKIAECLSSIESYISSINEKVEQLKAHKKSLMQKLFPQNGKNVPEYRFSEFNNTKEWEIKKVGDIATTFSGGTPSISKKQYYGGDIPFIRSGEIKGTKTELSLTQLGVEKTSAKLVSAGTILYALYGATSGEVAISKISGAINQAILAIIVDNELCEVQFLYQILLANKEKILDKYLQGGQGNLSGSIITNLQILLPPLVEQSKIAECLSSIDRAIECYSQKTILLEQHKKGLMQQLFLKS